MPPRQREEVLNAKLGQLLIARNPSWTPGNVHIEETGLIRNRAGWKIDVLVENPSGQPVVIETKRATGQVDSLAQQIGDRMHGVVHRSGKAIEAGIGVVYPKGQTDLKLDSAVLKYATYQLTAEDRMARTPADEDEWLTGTVDDLADIIEVVSLSEKLIDTGQQILANAVLDTSGFLHKNMQQLNLGEVLHQADSEQTIRMASAIIVNAFVFHYAIEGEEKIPLVDKGRGKSGYLKSRVVSMWDKVLEVNYWPIFSIAQSILRRIPTRMANRVLNRAAVAAENLLDVGAASLHDLAGRMFQTLISDRKFLATFYTLPSSAALLAELAVARMNVDWSDPVAIEDLRIADFACGTGALLSAVQRSVYRRIRRSGGDDTRYHQQVMENVLLGTDIMPSAVHLTTSMLSSAHPGMKYRRSLIRTLPYGVDEELSGRTGKSPQSVYLGALDLIGTEFGESLFSLSDMGHMIELGGFSAGARGAFTEDSGSFPVQDGTFDLVVMNPPFVRPIGQEGKKIGIPVPSFAGFDTSEEEQRAMSQKLSKRRRGFGSGQVGLASNFMDLAHVKLKPGGTLALVLPFTFASGVGWRDARTALTAHYKDILIVSIATHGTSDRAFSADTGMAECLVIAKKKEQEGECEVESTAVVNFANIPERPRGLVDAYAAAKTVKASVVSSTFEHSGFAGIRDLELGEVMVALRKGRLKLPRLNEVFDIAITSMEKVANRGLLHRDINDDPPRGAFDVKPLKGKRKIPTYPMLWRHKAKMERHLIVQPDTYGSVRRGYLTHANNTWKATASRLHHNLDFQLNSQSLGICLTPELSIGGRAWPNLLPHDERYELPMLLWGNTTLGLMMFWWSGTRQQGGRAGLKISAIPDLPTLDVRVLSEEQMHRCRKIFDDFKDQKFLPANEAFRDQTRKRLDSSVFDMLGLPAKLTESMDLLRLKWCSEPSVHGGKSTRPGA